MGCAREELRLTAALTAIAGIGWETTHLKGDQYSLHLYLAGITNGESPGHGGSKARTGNSRIRRRGCAAVPASRTGYSVARVATGYGTPQVSNLFVLPNGSTATTPS